MELNRELSSFDNNDRDNNVPENKQPDPLAEREAHLLALQEQLAAQERDYHRKVRELGRAEQELEDERQIFLQDKKAFDRALAQSKQRTRLKGLLLVPILLVSSMGVGYASFAALSQDQVKMVETTSQLNALSQRLRNAELQQDNVETAPIETPAFVAEFEQNLPDESAQMVQALASNPSSAGQLPLQKATITTKVDELLEQLALLKQEMIDQNVLMDVDDAFIDIQQAHLSDMANRLARLQKETLTKAEDYDRLLQANRALVKQINSLRSENK